MGGGVSSQAGEAVNPDILYKNKRDQESKKSDMLHQVEFFILNIYSNFPAIESVRFLLSSELAQAAFEKHLVAIEKDECLRLYHEINHIFIEGYTADLLFSRFGSLVSYYINPRLITKDFPNLREPFLSYEIIEKADVLLHMDRANTPNFDQVIISYLREIIEFIIAHISENYVKEFFLSRHFALWRSVERSHALATTVDDIRRIQRLVAHDWQVPHQINKNINQVDLFHHDIYASSNHHEKSVSSRRVEKLKPVLADQIFNSQKFTNFSLRALVNVEIEDLIPILTGDNWFAALISAVEGLPIGFTIASASKARIGFPIIYSNKYFSMMTGYKRSEIIGLNCKFLQCDKTEKAKLLQVSKCLTTAKCLTTVLTNQTKSRQIFMNLLSFKPIFNASGEYSYVLCVHVDVTHNLSNYQKEFNFATKLMTTLPSRIITEDVGVLRSSMPSAAPSPKCNKLPANIVLGQGTFGDGI